MGYVHKHFAGNLIMNHLFGNSGSLQCVRDAIQLSTDSKFDPQIYQNPSSLDGDISDGDIFATIQSYKVPFLERLGPKFEGGDLRLRIPVVPVTKMLSFRHPDHTDNYYNK